MSTIYANNSDGWQQHMAAAWNDSHDGTGNGNPTTNTNNYNWAIAAAYYDPPRNFYITRRVFLDFNTSGITSTLSDATLSVYVGSATYDDLDIIILKSGHDPSDTSEDWFGTWLTGLGGTLSGWSRTDPEVIPYTEATGQDSGTGYLNIPLNPNFKSFLYFSFKFSAKITHNFLKME